MEAVGGSVQASESTAMDHFMIAAAAGDDEAIDYLKRGYELAVVSKEDLAAAFQTHKAANDALYAERRARKEEKLYPYLNFWKKNIMAVKKDAKEVVTCIRQKPKPSFSTQPFPFAIPWKAVVGHEIV